MNIKYTKHELFFVAALSAIAVACFIAVLVPSLREKGAQILNPDKRVIVSTISADLLGNGHQFKILKIKNQTGLTVEVYETNDDGSSPLLEKLELKNSRDAFFEFRGNATRLALQDVDGDDKPEILVPSFDRDLIAHIYVLKMEPLTHKLELVSN